MKKMIRNLDVVAKGRRVLFAAAALPFVALSVVDRAEAAPYVEPHQCGGDAQPACYVSAAKKIRDADPGSGAFWDGYDGGGWWNCDGWNRTWDAVHTKSACSKGWFNSRPARLIYKHKDLEKDGIFLDIFRQEWWRCPPGFTRNANPVHKGEACSATIGKACDAGLVDVRDSRREFSWDGGGYTCYKKGQCGAEGQRPCQLAVDGIQTSCNKGLEEDFIKNECRIGVFGDIDDLDKDFAKFYKDAWEGRAIIDQVEFSLDVPLAYATMIGSHNSYNSKAYDYLDPNQYLTILDQLKGGAHFIEMDLHDRRNVRPTSGPQGLELGTVADGIVLCHSKHEKKGPIGGACTEGDRYLDEGLDELKVFLEDSKFKSRIFIIYFENYSSDTAAVYDAVQKKIGSYVYNSGGCRPIPAETLTARQVLDAGKRVLIWNGAEVEKKCSDHAGFKSMVFTGLGWDGRTFEDETSVTDLLGGVKKKWLPADVVAEIEKGKNLAAHDFLYVNDVYKAMAWSWSANEPNNTNEEDCAWQTNKARLGKGHVWNDGPCWEEGFFACQNLKGEWKVTSTRGPWSEGEASCKKDFGDDYFFSFPATAEDNLALTNAKPSGVQPWLNLNDQTEEGTWVGKHRWNSFGKGVQIQNRWKSDQYVQMQDGQIKSGAVQQPASLEALWEQVPIKDSPYIRLRSRSKTDHYAHIEHGKLESGAVQPGWWSAQWKEVPVDGSSYVRFQNRWKNDQYLHIEHGKLESGTIQPGWHSAQWRVLPASK